MSLLQRRLSAFLDLEMHHSLGAYRRTHVELRELEKQLVEDEELSKDVQIMGKQHIRHLIDLARIMRNYNLELDSEHDRAREHARHPAPAELPLSQLTFPESNQGARPGEPDGTSGQSLTWVSAFYDATLQAIDADGGPGAQNPAVRQLQRALLVRRAELQRDAGDQDEIDETQRRRRRKRFERRRGETEACGIPARIFAEGTGDPEAPKTTIETIVGSHLGSGHRRPLGAFVLRAMVDAHLAMHEVEAHRSRTLGVRIEKRSEEIQDEEQRVLKRCVALNTLVWSAARTAPWMFAEDGIERQFIVGNYDRAWKTAMPIRPMWISAQVSLLALHRRAYARVLMGDRTAAYKDFHKLQYHLRDTARRTLSAPIHLEGVAEFIDALDALADHHIGELYRQDRDHVSALKHYRRAHVRLERLKREEHGDRLMTNSRWFVRLQLSLGKACYELGQHKTSLSWFLKAWRSLLELIAADTRAEVNTHAVDVALDWLDRVIDEPELHKTDVTLHLTPIIEQIEDLRVDSRLTALASDIQQCLGHLLAMLNLSSRDEPLDRELAFRCIRRAWQQDKHNTRAIADLLKLRYNGIRDEKARSEDLERLLDRLYLAQEQWPGGSTHVESLSRVIEMTLLQQLRHANPTAADDANARLARELLHSLLTHTDSVEARKSQVHEYLTRAPTATELPGTASAPAVEFICLRRYSSAYPILPRPSEFRAHGGGYFVRIHPRGDSTSAFGIAVDPGTSYVECLYRSGFTLADIDMVVVTHDHVDHASSLEPLLALRHEMSELGNKKPLIVLGNRSVLQRWKSIRTYERDDTLRFFSMAGKPELTQLSKLVSKRVAALDPDCDSSVQISLTSLSSRLADSGRGHGDLAGNPAFGLLISVAADGAATTRSLAITGDLPAIPDGPTWSEHWQRALAADVFVCHLSTVPLAELRQMARLTTPADGRVVEDIAWINENWRRQDTGDRLRYAHWLQGANGSSVAPVGDDTALGDWIVPRTHPYLGGLLRLAQAVDQAQATSPQRLLVIGELSEELGSFRRKIAHRLNERILTDTNLVRACTGDIGLRVLLDSSAGNGPEAVRVLCSTCELDNDLAPFERYHQVGEISEVCVKGENEGTFYNCSSHDPARRRDDPVFLEKHERYDVFGR